VTATPTQIDRTPSPIRWLGALLAIVFVAYACNLIFGLGSPALDAFFAKGVYPGLIVISAVLVLARAVAVPTERAGWLCIGIGLATTAFAEVYWLAAYANADVVPVPSLSDLGWLLTYPAWCLGLALVIGSRVRRFRSIAWLDAAIVALAVGALATAFIGPTIIDAAGESVAAVAVSIAYPVGDVLLVAFVAGMLILTGWRRDVSWALVAAGLIVVAVGDTVYEYQAAQGAWIDGTWLDLTWPLSALLLGFSAWSFGPRIPVAMPSPGRRAIGVAAVSSLIALGLLIYGYAADENVAAFGLAVATLIAAGARMAITFYENQRLYTEVQTDPLTGLHNRGRLAMDLRDELEHAEQDGPRVLAMFDLDGFKLYNDTFGHAAGDALLKRLGARLAAAAGDFGSAYRVGGDEFCLLVTSGSHAEQIVQQASQALHIEGSGFSVSASHGSVWIPSEADTPDEALQLADKRMYIEKRSSRASARSQAQDVLMRALREREPGLAQHVDNVANLAAAVARHFISDADDLDVIGRAAELHDIGKMAVPDAILNKPGPLDDEEWAFIKDHTLVGERILSSAEALTPVAEIVRSSHERWDGAGYPDGLADDEIPLGARIIFVCDAFTAMTDDRPYSPAKTDEEAIAELRACSGTQFDPRIVEIVCREAAERDHSFTTASPSRILPSASPISEPASR
jgi:two-component system cell cycle response regulator